MKKTIVITGASGGIGRELSEIYAKKGHDLFLISRDERKLERVKETLEEDYGIRVGYFPIDLAKPGSANIVFEEMQTRGLQVDLLINNAGFGLAGRFEENDHQREVDMINLNITTLMELSKMVLHQMKKRSSGHIVNIASVAAFLPGPYMAVYYATKAFVLSFTEALSEELKGSGVFVTAICPGPTISGFQKEAEMESLKVLRFSNVMTSEKVAQLAVKGIEKKKVIVVTGLMNKLIVQLPRISPRAFVRKVVGSLQRP